MHLTFISNCDCLFQLLETRKIIIINIKNEATNKQQPKTTRQINQSNVEPKLANEKKVNRNSLRIHVEFDRKRTKLDRGKINSATKEEQ